MHTQLRQSRKNNSLQNLVLYIVRRFTLFVGSLVAASALVFLLLRILPGDLAQAKLGIDASPDALTQTRSEFGLDDPLILQFLKWLSHALRGDLGVSMLTGVNITQEIVSKATVTLPLIGLASALALIFAIPLGMYSALNFRQRKGITISAVSQLGIAIPTFWVGVILVTIFSVKFQIFPSGGFPDSGWSSWSRCLESLVLPATTLALGQGAMLMRFARALRTVGNDRCYSARILSHCSGYWSHTRSSTAHSWLTQFTCPSCLGARNADRHINCWRDNR
ncbi:MAG: hypothetical protein RLZ17_1053 [Actinomycetota bacterium]